MSGLWHLAALRWISLLEMGPARVMAEEGNQCQGELPSYKDYIVCLHWMFFLEGNSCSISCRKGDYLYSLNERSKTKRSDQCGKKTSLGCVGIAGHGLRTGCTLCLLCSLGKGRKGKSLCSCGSLWVFPPLPFPHETFLAVQVAGLGIQVLRLINRLGIDAF